MFSIVLIALALAPETTILIGAFSSLILSFKSFAPSSTLLTHLHCLGSFCDGILRDRSNHGRFKGAVLVRLRGVKFILETFMRLSHQLLEYKPGRKGRANTYCP